MTRETRRRPHKIDEAAIADALRRYVESDEPIHSIAGGVVHPDHLLSLLRGRPGYAEAAVRRKRLRSPNGAGKRAAPLVAVAQPAPIQSRTPLPRAAPGVALPPVALTWEQIVDLAWNERREVRNRDDLVAWNRSRIARGHAPICIRPSARAAA